MDFNYTLKYRTYTQLLEEVSVDFNTYALENMIDPQTLIKLVKKLNYDLGLRINQTKEVVLDVCHGKVKLPDDFYTFNYALICGDYIESVGYGGMQGGTNIQEIPYREFPAEVNQCVPPTINCAVCNANPCNHTAACPSNTCPPTCVPSIIPGSNDPLAPYGDVCTRPRVFMNCKGEKWELIQVINSGITRTFKALIPLRMIASREIECDCPNLYWNVPNQGWIKGGFLFANFDNNKVYLNYQGTLENEDGELMVPDHDLLNEYYEYALKLRILENLYMNGEDVGQKMQLIEQRTKTARNAALSLVNTPNFKEMEELWWQNRRAQYSKYYDMFKSYSPNLPYFRNPYNTRVI